jgi:GT2 family glycosyltransferase
MTLQAAHGQAIRHAFSFIVPFHRDLGCLARCLASLGPRPPLSELIVAADGALEDCRPLALTHGARVVQLEGPLGPAAARNRAADIARGEVLVFVDADVAVSRSGLVRLTQEFSERQGIAAVFGAYDDHPGDPGFMSQYKNLSHSFIHQVSSTSARTFWTGFGAVRADAFRAVHGFDERLKSIEDIDLGYRLTERGYKVVLDPTLTACHLKRWTVRSAIVSDVRDRGVPWTQLILKYGALENDLNLRQEHRWSVVLVYLALVALALAAYEPRLPAVAGLFLAASTVINRRYYRFFLEKRGAWFTVSAWLLHQLHHVYNGLSLVTGAVLFASTRYLGVSLPGAIPHDRWSDEPKGQKAMSCVYFNSKAR